MSRNLNPIVVLLIGALAVSLWFVYRTDNTVRVEVYEGIPFSLSTSQEGSREIWELPPGATYKLIIPVNDRKVALADLADKMQVELVESAHSVDMDYLPNVALEGVPPEAQEFVYMYVRGEGWVRITSLAAQQSLD